MKNARTARLGLAWAGLLLMPLLGGCFQEHASTRRTEFEVLPFLVPEALTYLASGTFHRYSIVPSDFVPTVYDPVEPGFAVFHQYSYTGADDWFTQSVLYFNGRDAVLEAADVSGIDSPIGGNGRHFVGRCDGPSFHERMTVDPLFAILLLSGRTLPAQGALSYFGQEWSYRVEEVEAGIRVHLLWPEASGQELLLDYGNDLPYPTVIDTRARDGSVPLFEPMTLYAYMPSRGLQFSIARADACRSAPAGDLVPLADFLHRAGASDPISQVVAAAVAAIEASPDYALFKAGVGAPHWVRLEANLAPDPTLQTLLVKVLYGSPGGQAWRGLAYVVAGTNQAVFAGAETGLGPIIAPGVDDPELVAPLSELVPTTALALASHQIRFATFEGLPPAGPFDAWEPFSIRFEADSDSPGGVGPLLASEASLLDGGRLFHSLP